jgi:ABC-type nitrate/sulfonate/bicarbonate transport system substrate-binding protein
MTKLAARAAAILAMVVGLAGSAAGQAPAPLAAAVGGNMNHIPSFVGVEKGIFLKHGIDLKLKVLATGQEMSKALQAGEVQVIGSAYSNYPVAVERGMAARGVVGLMGDRTGRYSDEPVSIWTRKGTGIMRVEDLAGRKVGTPVGGTADEYLGVVLKKKGIAREQVTVLNVPPGNLVSALQGGGVDAVASWEPFGSLVQAKVPDALLVVRGGGHIGYYINMAVHDDVIGKSPELVERYVIGMVEATQYTRQHTDEAAEIATRWIPGLDIAVARQALRHMTFDPRITPHTIAAWDENVKVLLEQKKLRAAVPWQQGIELRFIEKVAKAYPQLLTDLKPVP